MTGAILGLAANFASVFLPDYHRTFVIALLFCYAEQIFFFTGDFTIFALIVPSLTILTFLIQWVIRLSSEIATTITFWQTAMGTTSNRSYISNYLVYSLAKWTQQSFRLFSYLIVSLPAAASWATYVHKYPPLWIWRSQNVVSDIIGYLQCDSLKNQTTPTAGGGGSECSVYFTGEHAEFFWGD